jgi:hypothetical protein
MPAKNRNQAATGRAPYPKGSLRHWSPNNPIVTSRVCASSGLRRTRGKVSFANRPLNCYSPLKKFARCRQSTGRPGLSPTKAMSKFDPKRSWRLAISRHSGWLERTFRKSGRLSRWRRPRREHFRLHKHVQLTASASGLSPDSRVKSCTICIWS